MLAHAFLAVATATDCDTQPTPTGLIALTVNEFRRRFDALLPATCHIMTSLLAWSRWRRRHQYRARHPTSDAANTNDSDLRSRHGARVVVREMRVVEYSFGARPDGGSFG
jgi:hypothetical protein